MKWLVGRWRLFWGLCPMCNSDAPEVDICRVCEGWRGVYSPLKDIKEVWWWMRYMDLIHD